MSRWTRRGRSARACVEQLADLMLPAEWRTRADWLQLRAHAVRQATALAEQAEAEIRAARSGGRVSRYARRGKLMRSDLYIGTVPAGRIGRAVLRALGGTVPPGQVITIDVEHDYDCPHLSGGECGCEPEAHVTWRSQPPGGDA